MKRALLSIGLGCLLGLLFAAPAIAYTPPETNPRIVVTTSRRDRSLSRLLRRTHPEHVEQFLLALAARRFRRRERGAGRTALLCADSSEARVARSLSGLAGRTRRRSATWASALSVYDSGEPGDVRNAQSSCSSRAPQLDSDYTSIGFVEAGMSVLEEIAATPTFGDHVPTRAHHDPGDSPRFADQDGR